jgi:DNA-binding transcriptional ArsR family regulator
VLLTTIDSQARQDKLLSTIFTSSARVAVLRVFMLDPTRAYYQRQIEVATGIPIRAVQRELDRLTAGGLLYRRSEGNRTYYQVDLDYPLFPELRGMILKTSAPADVLRGLAAVDPQVRLCFLSADAQSALVVGTPGVSPKLASLEGLQVRAMTSEGFFAALDECPAWLTQYLSGGADLLGRREDVIWRHIEAAGYQVKRGEGVP